MTDTKPEPRLYDISCCEDCGAHWRNKLFEDEPILCGHGDTFENEIDLDDLTDDQPFPEWCPLPKASHLNTRHDDWLSFDDFEATGYEGWCWIVYKGRVTEAYRDHNYNIRFNKYSDQGFLTECITYAMPWKQPQPPAQERDDG